MKPAIRYLLYGQLCFYAGLIICIVLKPDGLTLNDGISYYGIYAETVLPYILALLGSAYFAIKVAELYKTHQPLLRYALTAIGLFAIGVMITPDSLSQFMDGLHRVCGICLFVTQLLLSLWLTARLHFSLKAASLVLIELIGGVASFIWLAPPHGYLLESQVLFQIGFACLMIYALSKPEFEPAD